MHVPERNRLPRAVMGPYPYPLGRILSATEAQQLFGWAFDPQAQYKACYGAVRRIAGPEEERRFLVRAKPCKNGHHDVILVKPDGSGNYCAGCKRDAKRRVLRRETLTAGRKSNESRNHFAPESKESEQW